MKAAYDFIIFKFQMGLVIFSVTFPSVGAQVYKMSHCVFGFLDDVSEGGPDTYPNFWRCFSSTANGMNMLIRDLVTWQLKDPEYTNTKALLGHSFIWIQARSGLKFGERFRIHVSETLSW